MLSEPGDYIGQGEHRLFHPGNGSVQVTGTAGYLTVAVSGGTSGDSFSLAFAAAPGEQLAVGSYERAMRAPLRTAGRPGINVTGDGRGCNKMAGRFDVKQIQTDAGGAVTGLWIVFEQHCEANVPALFGEVRVGVAVPDGASTRRPGTCAGPRSISGARRSSCP